MGLQNTKSQKYEHIVHPFPPLYDDDSEILILGSLPSVKSREQMFFYGHPQNRFWKVMSRVLGKNSQPPLMRRRLCFMHITLHSGMLYTAVTS